MLEQRAIGQTLSYLASLTHEGDKLQSVTIQHINEASESDPTFSLLVEMIQNGCHDEKLIWPEEAHAYFRHRDHLTTNGSTVLNKGRMLIPASLPSELLETLHSVVM